MFCKSLLLIGNLLILFNVVTGQIIKTRESILSKTSEKKQQFSRNLNQNNDLQLLSNGVFCTGYLGDPVINITFGSGNNPAVPLNVLVPGATTTHQYVAVSGNPAMPTPIDGQYTITNNTPFNNAWFSGFEDHTPGDINGYMAFYNASENPGEFYSQTVSGLQSSTTYEFAAWIANVLNPSFLIGVTPEITFRIEKPDGSLLASYTTDDISQNSQFMWKQYGFYFTTPPATTQVVLKMINNRVGGTALPGNDLAIDDITFRPCVNNPSAKIINDYAEVKTFDPCLNTLSISNVDKFKLGDTVMLLQMKDAIVDSTNTSTFGEILDFKNAGRFEINYISGITGDLITMQDRFLHNYSLETGVLQLVRMPYFKGDYIMTDQLTAKDWDGKTGGVLAFTVEENIILQADMNVTGKGFRGGRTTSSKTSSQICNFDDFYYSSNDGFAAAKGESFARISDQKSAGKGKLASGGGGGVEHNSGGAGGGNGGAGGRGGYQLQDCGTLDNRAFGGLSLPQTGSTIRLLPGGGGGAGHGNQMQGMDMNGGNGGGIVFVKARSIRSNGFKIIADGENGVQCETNSIDVCHDGSGGGGAGGSIYLDIPVFVDALTPQVVGGKGADLNFYNGVTAARIGPGGGAGGGTIVLSAAGITIPSNSVAGGLNGSIRNDNNNPYGAQSGQSGTILQGVANQFLSNTPFTKNISNLQIQSAVVSCKTVEVNANVITAADPITEYAWDFNDGTIRFTRTALHEFNISGAYNIKLTIKDAKGCKDSAQQQVTISLPTAIAAPDTAVCKDTRINLRAQGGVTYKWIMGENIEDQSAANPSVEVKSGGTYSVVVTDNLGCTDTASVEIQVLPPPTFLPLVNQQVCEGGMVTLENPNNRTYIYAWSPANSLSNPALAEPVAIPQSNTIYTVSITEPTCGIDTNFNVSVTVHPKPAITATSSNEIDCQLPFSQLNAYGASSYSWSPASGVSNPGAPNPRTKVDTTTVFTVVGTSTFGCESTAEVTVKVTNSGQSTYKLPNAFTPNNDGKNDCFGVTHWGNISHLEFRIFNRWGEQVFYTTNPSECWTGTIKGNKLDSGGYIYLIKARSFCGDISRSGSVMLVR